MLQIVEVRKKEEGRRKKEEGEKIGKKVKTYRYNYLKLTKATILSISDREAIFIGFFFHAWYYT